MTLKEKMEALKRAGIKLSYADRGEHTFSSWRLMTADGWKAYESRPEHISYSNVHNSPQEDTRAYVDLGGIGQGEDNYGQTSTVKRSNFRALQRDYPETFTNVSYSNVDSLGAYVANLDEDMIDTLKGLRNDYPVYDDEDMSALESEEIQESYEYAASDVADKLTDESRDMWDALADVKLPAHTNEYGYDVPERNAQESLFWDAYMDNEGNDYAEHSGLDVVWNREAMADALATKLDSYFSSEPAAEGQDTLPGMDREAE